MGIRVAPFPAPVGSPIEIVGGETYPLPGLVISTPSISPPSPIITLPAAPSPPPPIILITGGPDGTGPTLQSPPFCERPLRKPVIAPPAAEAPLEIESIID